MSALPTFRNDVWKSGKRLPEDSDNERRRVYGCMMFQGLAMISGMWCGC